MSTDQRLKEIQFIENDIKERGEEITSDIQFFACIYSMKVKIDGKSKKIFYSSAAEKLNGYRPIIQNK